MELDVVEVGEWAEGPEKLFFFARTDKFVLDIG